MNSDSPLPGRAEDSPALEPVAAVDPIPVRVAFELSRSGNSREQSGWQLAAVEPGESGDELAIRLFRSECQGYYLNLTSGAPSIFVHWRLEGDAPEAIAVTLSYDEAARTMDGGEIVDRVPMPDEMIAWVGEYVALHYQPESTRKRRGAKPSFMPREEFARLAARESARARGAEDEEPQ